MNTFANRMKNMDTKKDILNFIKENDKVLDLGAGSGCLEEMLDESIYVTMVESNTEMIEILEKITNEKRKLLKFDITNKKEIENNLKDDTFDVIVLSSILHEFLLSPKVSTKIDIVNILCEYAKHLNKNGRIIIREPVMLENTIFHQCLDIEKTSAEYVSFFIKNEYIQLAEIYMDNHQIKYLDKENKEKGISYKLTYYDAFNLMFCLSYGEESFSREQFEKRFIFSMDDYIKLFSNLRFLDNPINLRIISLEVLTQYEYYDFFNKIGTITYKENNVIMPPSMGLFVWLKEN